MNQSQIPLVRLINQRIAGAKHKSVSDVVSYMGAMQAQDFNMAKWAAGLRANKSSEKDVEAAIDNAEMIRTHLLRPTWHFVSPKDIYWMLDLTAGKIISSFNSRHNAMGLTKSVLNKGCRVIEKALAGGNHLTREELISELKKAKIAIFENRASHIFGWAEYHGIACSGRIKNGKPTFALLEERVPHKNILMKEESLAMLAKKYFESRGPATLDDFSWWSGLTIKDCRQAAELIKADFISEKIGGQNYLYSNSFSVSKTDDDSVFLLPAFDEFLISYKDRSASLPREQYQKSISNNGIFRPMIVANGRIIGVWKFVNQKGRKIIETDYFNAPGKSIKNLVAKEVHKLEEFLDQKIEII